MSDFFAYISRMKYIKRWGLMPSSRDENVQEHSLQVAMIAYCLALIANKHYGQKLDAEHVMAMAVFHETGEVITGDLVTPIKYYNPTITSAYKEIEKTAEDRMIGMLPTDLREEFKELIRPSDSEAKRYVKAADKIAAYAKCLEELRSGNQEFFMAKESLKKAIFDMQLPAANEFMKEYMPSFEVTLDELNRKPE